ENHLRWDSLGEFLALGASLEEVGIKQNSSKAAILAKTLDKATGLLLENGKSPSKVTGELDNRGSHYYLAKYWAQMLSEQTEDLELQEKFVPLAKTLTEKEDEILSSLIAEQWHAVDVGGYYKTDADKTKSVMRPSAIFNKALADVK
ncbi:MAG: NADP-dependent isocitrate dehydrogenase, partial [Gammaproteobacteria bacterium]